jgi:hypothetical protein
MSSEDSIEPHSEERQTDLELAEKSEFERKNGSTSERTAWITVLVLAILAGGLTLEIDRLLLKSVPSTLQTQYQLQEFIPSEIFDIVCMSIATAWMAVIMAVDIMKRISANRNKQLHESPHIGSYLIYGLCFFALGGTLRNVIKLLLMLDYSCSEISGRVYQVVAITYVMVQLAFIYCNRKRTIFNVHLVNGLLLFHVIVTNGVLYLRMFVESKLEIFNSTAVEEERSDNLCNCTDTTEETPWMKLQLSSKFGYVHPNAVVYVPRGGDNSCKLGNDVYLKMFESSSIFLTPFLLEFSLTATAMLVELWLEANDQEETQLQLSTHYGSTVYVGAQQTSGESSRVSVTEKMRQATGAVVLGITVFGCFILMLTLLHFMTAQSHPALVFQVFKMVVCVTMTVLCVLGHVILHRNRIQSRGIGLDEVLIYISVLGPFALGIFHMISSIEIIDGKQDETNEILQMAQITLTNKILWIILSIFQSTFISKALHRLPMPRNGWMKVISPCNLAIILGAFNLGMWLVCTINIESVGESSFYSDSMATASTVTEKAYYGKQTWLWIVLLLLPLSVFFHIHSFFTLFRVFHIHSHVA